MRAQTPAAAAAIGSGPMASVKGTIDQAVAVFRDKSVAAKDREQKLRAIAEDCFDFERMARAAVGYHWRDFTPGQREEFVPLFTKFIEDVYLSRIESYSVEKVEQEIQSSSIQFARERIDPDSPDEAEVFSSVTLQNRDKPVPVNYLLEKGPGGWKIYDLSVDSISVIANYRNQFNRVLNDGGYDKLVSILRQKQQALSGSLAQ